MKKSDLKAYADLIAQKGLNVQKGQEVLITCGLEQPEFVAMVVESLYKRGAKKVVVDWAYNPLYKLDIKYQSDETLGRVDKLAREKLKWRAESLPAQLHILSEDPDGLKGIDIAKMMRSQRARMKVVKPFRDKMENKYQWCIVAVPGKKWAKKIFPELSTSKAMEKLWENILQASRVYGDPIKNWEEHNLAVKEKCTVLNGMKLKQLHYTSKNGTDFTVELNENGRFCGGYDTTLSGVDFNPNIPSEEVFTSPKAGKAEGIVYATKPLSYNGQLIENFHIKFKGGKAVEVYAEKNQALLEQMISIDEGASMLGECALVPYDSPINNTGILFYETLFDENCCCHLALGRGFADCLYDYEKMTKEEHKQNGINDSQIHVDFMIGASDLQIVGIDKRGNKVLIFKDGNWAL